MLVIIWILQDIFGKKFWKGEWKKDNLRVKFIIEK